MLLSQIRSIYAQHLDLQLDDASCYSFDDKLAIALEGTLTPTERFLWQNRQEALAREVRFQLDRVLLARVEQSIEEVFGVKVADFLSQTNLATGRTAAIAVVEIGTRRDLASPNRAG